MTRQVALADDAYEMLAKFRGPDESFSDVVRRWGEDARRKALREVWGTWKISDAEAKRITDEIYAARRNQKARGSEK